MIGYKLLDKGMKATNGNNMQYELGKLYSLPKEDIKVGSCGYHFYENLIDCINTDLYDISNSRFFKVTTGEYIITSDDILCTNEITLLEEITRDDLIKFVNANKENISKVARARLGIDLDVLYKDEDWYVRADVARQGAHLDELYKDEDWYVRVAVVRQRAHLDELYKDANWSVRIAVVRQRAHLDELYKDANCYVRAAVIEQMRIVNDRV